MTPERLRQSPAASSGRPLVSHGSRFAPRDGEIGDTREAKGRALPGRPQRLTLRCRLDAPDNAGSLPVVASMEAANDWSMADQPVKSFCKVRKRNCELSNQAVCRPLVINDAPSC